MPATRTHVPSTTPRPQRTTTTRHKRPLLHPPPTSTTIYISRKTPFISGIKRIDTLLASLHKSVASNAHRKPMSASATPRATPGVASTSQGKSEPAVTVKATGRAIERVLQVGVFLMQRGDVDVRIETGTVGAVDDLVIRKKGGEGEKSRKDTGGVGGGHGDDDKEMGDVETSREVYGADEDDVEEEEKTVTRGVSVCQLIVKRKA